MIRAAAPSSCAAGAARRLRGRAELPAAARRRPAPSAPLVSVNPAAETVAAPPDDWWRLYDDPALDG